MIDLSTDYLGIKLKNPLIVGSCGLTNSVGKLKELEENGAGAVVLKSIFEEEIYLEFRKEMDEILGEMENNLEFLDYFDYQLKDEKLHQYLKLVNDAKKKLSIPVIASINCVTAQNWIYYARKIQEAGADAIELNIFMLPTDLRISGADYEKRYFSIIEKVTKEVSIPVSVKISHYFSNLAGIIQRFSQTGVSGLVLFNRFYQPDIDISREEIVHSNVYSNPSDYLLPLRWIAIMSNRVNCDLIASTGIHEPATVIKMLLAGASAIQMVSGIYKYGPDLLGDSLEYISHWMKSKGYQSISDFKGKLNLLEGKEPSIYERVQFMKYFGDQK